MSRMKVGRGHATPVQSGYRGQELVVTKFKSHNGAV